jgi:hypothetical protein
MYKLIADLVVLSHFLVIIALVSGTIALLTVKSFKNTVMGKSYYSLGLITVSSWPVFKGCPLTILELWLRRHYDPTIFFSEGFTAHYLEILTGVRISGAAFTWIMLLIAVIAVGYLILPRMSFEMASRCR